jgi:hypothetical protein
MVCYHSLIIWRLLTAYMFSLVTWVQDCNISHVHDTCPLHICVGISFFLMRTCFFPCKFVNEVSRILGYVW